MVSFDPPLAPRVDRAKKDRSGQDTPRSQRSHSTRRSTVSGQPPSDELLFPLREDFRAVFDAVPFLAPLAPEEKSQVAACLREETYVAG